MNSIGSIALDKLITKLETQHDRATKFYGKVHMVFQNDKLRSFADLFFQDSEQPTLKREWIAAEEFDYSLESLRKVDAFLLRVRNEEASQDEWARLILRCGAYVGEVIRQNIAVLNQS